MTSRELRTAVFGSAGFTKLFMLMITQRPCG